jgi:hypothetical protein
LHAEVSRSDIAGFIIVFLAYLLNEFHGLSYLLGRETENKKPEDKPEDKKPQYKPEDKTQPTDTNKDPQTKF